MTPVRADDTVKAVNDEALALGRAGVNKIILSSHLQDSANEKRLVGNLRNVDTKIVENGALVPGAPNVNLATTNFTAANGDSYSFRDLKGVAAGVPYQQSLYDYIVKDLGGVVSSAKYPATGAGRIVITGE